MKVSFFKCDRCETMYDIKDNNQAPCYCGMDQFHNLIKKDLCPACRKSLSYWFHNLDTKVEEEEKDVKQILTYDKPLIHIRNMGVATREAWTFCKRGLIFMSNEDLTVSDVINTMTKEQKNTLYFYVGLALREKIKHVPKCAAIESFDENQLKVFYYLVGAAMENTVNKDDILEIVGN